MAGKPKGLIDAIAEALALALQAHGIPPSAGNATIYHQCQRLCHDWGGEEHWVAKVWRPGRDAAISEAIADGASIEQAAIKAHCGPRTITRVRVRARRQATGFGSDEWLI